jgi:hypothetical protein
MKVNSFAILSLLSLVSSSVARPGNRFRSSGSFSSKHQSTIPSLTDESACIAKPSLTIAFQDDDSEPINQKSRVTAFVNTDKGLKVECWEIGDLMPDVHVTRADGSTGVVRQMKMDSTGEFITNLFSFPPASLLFRFGTSGVHSNGIDFKAKPK